VYPGVGWVIWRSAEYLPQELVFNINYLGAEQSSFTLNFSKSASQIVGQYYQLIRLGQHGYRAIMSNLTRTADYLTEALEEMDFVIMSKRSGEGLPLVAFRFPHRRDGGEDEDERHYDEFTLAHSLRARGWVVPAYTMAPKTDGLKMLRVVVREDFTRSKCDMLIADIKLCCGMLQETKRETIRKQEEYFHKYFMANRRGSMSHPAYKVCSLEPSSLPNSETQ
jgi:glutamate decarboxylase